jgi:site-specific DNA-methyltransferase (adenine-specific)
MNNETALKNRTLYFGDNLQVIENRIPDGFFDLIYLDPPFNSNKNYNVLFKEGKVDSTAQIRAFEDTWEWTPSTIKLFDQLKDNKNPQIAILIGSLYEILSNTPMMAYLVNMTARLIPLRRVLKDTGTIYLHCDPTASHYLKILMDVIFGKENFVNEVIWAYRTQGATKRHWSKKHDVLLFYSKKPDNYSFNYMTERSYMQHKYGFKKDDFKLDEDGRQYRDALVRDVWEISALQSATKEQLGYPTQKPEALLERIIYASSNVGDWILDPFCGCGTTVAVAEKLNRNWVGIDISMQAVNVIKDRMNNHYPDKKIIIDGIPMDFESAKALAEKDKFAFQDWAITLVGANPPKGETKKGADRGIDGIILFRDKVDYANPKLRKILVQVKGGASGRGDVAKLKGDIERDDAPMGILITLNEPTSEMRREAALAGEYHYSESTSFPRIQILSIHDWFNGKEAKIPSDKINPFKKAEAKRDQPSLLE